MGSVVSDLGKRNFEEVKNTDNVSMTSIPVGEIEAEESPTKK